jgi:peptidoglycan/LPS O-acetylase OafA/YrhL
LRYRSEGVNRPTWGNRLVGIEGLRALAAVSVLTHHVWSYSLYDTTPPLGRLNVWVFPNLVNGLTLFFTLSGFLLYRPFAASLIRGDGLPSIAAYFQNRALRILPAYWVILVLVSVVFGAATTRSSAGLTDLGHLSPGLLVKNLLLVQNYSPGSLLTGIPVAWSLVVEVIFYLCLPFLAIAVSKPRRGAPSPVPARQLLMPAALLLLIGIVGKAIASHTLSRGSWSLLWGGSWHAVLERSFLASADLFAYGMAAAVVVALADAGRLAGARAVSRWSGPASVCLALASTAWATHQHGDLRIYTNLVALSAALAILWLVLPARSLGVRRVLESRAIVWIGVVSYSVYLWHLPVILWLREHNFMASGRVGFGLNWLVVMSIVLVLSALTHRLVEAPAMRRKRRMTPTLLPERLSGEAGAIEAAP